MRSVKTLALILVLGLPLPVLAASIPVQLYKNPQCTCCDDYASYLNKNGFDVKLINTNDMGGVKHKYAVPAKLEGCHTALIGKYVFEGLIPAEYIQRVLKEHPPIKGLSLPGMRVGAPGMPGEKTGPLNVYVLEDKPNPRLYASF